MKIIVTPQAIVPQKRQKTLKEREEIYQFQANLKSLLFSSFTRTSFSMILVILIGNTQINFNIIDIKIIIQNIISLLVSKLKRLKEEIKKLKTFQNFINKSISLNKIK